MSKANTFIKFMHYNRFGWVKISAVAFENYKWDVGSQSKEEDKELVHKLLNAPKVVLYSSFTSLDSL